MNAPKDMRLAALRRFAFAITLLNVLGHTWFGFEQAWAAPLVGVGTAYAVEVLLECIVAWQQRRRPRFAGRGAVGAIDFLLSAHITGLAVSMLLYSDDQMGPIAFGTAVAIGSKYIFRVGTPASRHFFNPSNFGITVTLLCFASVGISQPYMFTERLNPTGAWVLPAILVCAGTMLNALFTRRIPLILAWVGGFVAQAMVRWALFGNLPLGSLMPLTGVALLLFTFYMVTDPATTPEPAWRQAGFGAAVAAVYGVLLAVHVVFAPFFALTIVSLGRGALLWATARRRAAVPVRAAASTGLRLEPALEPTAAGQAAMSAPSAASARSAPSAASAALGG